MFGTAQLVRMSIFRTMWTVFLFYGVMSGFSRLIMKTKYVWHSSISPHVNFPDNMNSSFTSKKLQVGGGRATMWRGKWNRAIIIIMGFDMSVSCPIWLHFPILISSFTFS